MKSRNLLDLLIEVRNKGRHSDIAIEEIYLRFKPKSKKLLYQTSFQEREDLDQLLSIQLLTIINKFDPSKTPTFSEFASIHGVKGLKRVN